MMTLIKLTLRELKNHQYFSILFIINLSLGLSGFVSLDIFKHSLDQTLKKHSKSIAGADLSLSARRPVSIKEREVLYQAVNGDFHESQITQMYSMVMSSSGQSRLVQIKAIEENYPFYGNIDLVHQGKVKNSGQADLHRGKTAWVYPEVLLQMKLKKGDMIFIGSEQFHISDIVEDDPSGSISNSVAPRIYISQKNLDSTHLVRPGSLAWHSYVYKIPDMYSSQLENIKESIFSQLDDPQLRINTHISSSENQGRLIRYLNDFFALTALIALFLTCIGMGFLFHSYFKTKIYEIAILNTLGFSQTKTFLLYFLQLLVLGVIGFFAACGFGFILLFFLQTMTAGIFPFEVDIQFNFTGVSFLLACLIPIMVCFPLIVKIKKVKPSVLLSGNIPQGWDKFSLLFFIPGLVILWIMAIWQSHSFYIGTVFTGFFSASGILLALFAGFFLTMAGKWNFFSSNVLRWSLRDLSRHRSAFLSCFLSLSLGVFLLNLIPQIYVCLEGEIKNPEKSKLPSLFAFDIQAYQVEGFKKLLMKNKVKLNTIAPMIHSRLLSVNGEPFDKGEGNRRQWAREREREMRFRNRGMNLSYRNFMYDHEKILKGSFWKEDYDPSQKSLPGISMETRFAKRLDLKMGDVLTFHVQNQKITGVIQNLRKVKWSTFDPNFFILFQGGILNFAEKTFLASTSHLPDSLKLGIQNKVISHFPNISLVDVTRVTNKIFTLSAQMLKALQLMAVLCLLAGFVVLYSICSHQVRSRRKEVALLKILGVSFSDIRKLFLYQFGLIALAASVLGLIVSIVVSYFLSLLIFDSAWFFSLLIPIGICAGVVFMALIVTFLIIRRALQTPVQILFEE